MTRAQETLMLTTQSGCDIKAQSLFIAELLGGAGPELLAHRPDGRDAGRWSRPKTLKRRARSIAHAR